MALQRNINSLKQSFPLGLFTFYDLHSLARNVDGDGHTWEIFLFPQNSTCVTLRVYAFHFFFDYI